jgi:hypothetical protein
VQLRAAAARHGPFLRTLDDSLDEHRRIVSTKTDLGRAKKFPEAVQRTPAFARMGFER